MGLPLIKSGTLYCGGRCTFGDNVVIDVAETVTLGGRCVIGDNAYFSGRRVQIGDDFFNYSWEWKRLDIGRGRRDDEYAILTVGSRCTFHDARIDLARHVTIGNDVGLSPEVCIYTHHYWQSPLEGYPLKYAPVTIEDGVLVGFRTTILPGSHIGEFAMVGAGSVVVGNLGTDATFGGVPAREIALAQSPSRDGSQRFLASLFGEYAKSLEYRRQPGGGVVSYSLSAERIDFRNCWFDLDALTVTGIEDEYTDDLRWFLFTHGIRFYTKRPFRKLPRREA